MPEPVDALFEDLYTLTTENINPQTRKIDQCSIEAILDAINREDRRVSRIVKGEIPHIAKAVKLVVRSFQQQGRLIYVGAGTSGRLGVLDASECPPTFGVSPDVVQGIIAGGPKALIRSREGVEDKAQHGADAIVQKNITRRDVVCGISASRRTPFVLGALQQARKLGARTIFIACNPRAIVNVKADVKICPVVGPEVIMGSTRMKAGTAQKLILNMITTAAMIRIGKTYGNLMVDLQMTSRKLRERSKRIVMLVTGVDYHTAASTLKQADGQVKTALVMLLSGVDADTARKRLDRTNGFVRKAIR